MGVLVHVQQRLRHRHVDPVAAAGALALVERGQDARRALERCVHIAVAVRIVRVVGSAVVFHRAAGVALGLGDARLGAHHGGVGAPTHPGPGLAVAADRGVHDARVTRRYGLVAEAHSRSHAGAEVLDEHVALLGQGEQQLARLGLVHVEADVALAGVLLDEVAGEAVHPRVGEAGHVAIGRLDLDDLGAEVAEHPGAVRPTEHAGEIEHADTGQRAGTGGGSRRIGHGCEPYP